MFWKQYGIKISDYSWHQMYYFVTGNHSPSFVPNPIAQLVVLEFYNDKEYHDAWRDKNMFDRLLPNVTFPNTILKCIRNRYYVLNKYYNKSNEDVVAERVASYVQEHNCDIIIKPTRDTGFGRSVSKYHITSFGDAKNAIREWSDCENFIVQECVKQHEVFAQLNKSSTNMIRVLSWRHDDVVDILFATVRSGIEGSITDVSFPGGKKK